MNDRLIEFRAWDKFQKKMISWDECLNNEDLIPEILLNAVRYEPMQCTGLKDKNGTLIYEGDIVEHDTAAGPKCWPVLFKDGCFVLPYESGNAWLGKVIQNCPYSSGVVVVGNIHDNADLLEGVNEKATI